MTSKFQNDENNIPLYNGNEFKSVAPSLVAAALAHGVCGAGNF
jgi:hypothetical protein